MLWSLSLLPLLAGAAIWAGQPVAALIGQRRSEARHRLVVGAAGVVVLLATLGLALGAAWTRPQASYRWGAGLSLHASIDPIAGVVVVLVPTVALPIVAYAAAHEDRRGLVRLVGLLVVFVGAMELLVVAADLLTLLIGWELVGWASWALIGHEWWEADKPGAAADAFNTTRFGDLGLFLAAAVAFASAQSLAYSDLARVDGVLQDVMVFGIVLAAASKSAQVPFSPWLFSAMGGPTSVSALLHAATMVAAGAFILARLHEPLSLVAWFGPAVFGVGLLTAVLGGVVASLQPHAKKLLAASTSAHYGFMFVAIGAGYASIGVAHLVTHAAFKALLFLTAGIAIATVASEQLDRMRLASRLPAAAWVSLAGALALAAVPPLGGAWTKEKVVAAGGEVGAWLAVLVVVAGGLSSFYAARFHLLAYGRESGLGVGAVLGRPRPRRVVSKTAGGTIHGSGREGSEGASGHAFRTEVVAAGVLAAITLGLSVLWVPGAKDVVARITGGQVPTGTSWELAGSLALVAVGIYAAHAARRRERLVSLGLPAARLEAAADWLGLPAALRAGVVNPVLALCAALARLDDRVVDAGVRGAAAIGQALSRAFSSAGELTFDRVVEWLGRVAAGAAGSLRAVDDDAVDRGVEGVAAVIGVTGRDSRRLQTGFAHHYYVMVTVGLVAAAVAAAVWRS